MDTFIVGPRIYFNDRAIRYLDKLDSKKVLIVTDSVMVKLGIIHQVTDRLDEQKIPYQIYSDVEPDPSMETVKKGVAQFYASRPDTVIAIGGGSPIDVAKAILYFSMDIQKQFIDEDRVKKPFFISIPTTSGTGSEVTSYAVVTDKVRNAKIPLSDPLMIPDVAILDEHLTKSVPPGVTADTGMDVLTHAIEAFVSKKSNICTDMYAERAIKLVFSDLLRAYRFGQDLEARKNMHLASCKAGIAFTNATLGINHSLAHAVGASFHLPHGKSNAILLPYVIGFNASGKDGVFEQSSTSMKYAEIAKFIGLPCGSTEEGVQALIEAIKILNKTMGIPTSLKEAGVSSIDFSSHLQSIAESALKDICTQGNPKEVTGSDFIKILEKAYLGTFLNFVME